VKTGLFKLFLIMMALLIVAADCSFADSGDGSGAGTLTAMAKDRDKAQPSPTASPGAQPSPAASPGTQPSPAASPGTQPSPAASPSGDARTVRFRFLVVPGHTRALVDYVKILDKSGKVIAFLDIGSQNDTKGDNRVPVDNENQWGDARTEDGCTCRPVNEGNKRSQHSEFIFKLDRLPKDSPLKIAVRYKDSGDDLFPIEIFDGAEFRRIAQILLEDSGQWLEEVYKIPAVDIK